MKGIGSILGSLDRGDLITPYLEAAVEGDLWPDSYTVEVDSSPYYGLTDLSGENLLLGSGDGYFHPSTHPLMSARELYFHFHPKHIKDKPPRKKFNFAGAMTVSAGTALHSIIQTKLDMIGMLKDPEWEYVDEERKVRGRIDGVFVHPDEGEFVFEYKALDCDTPILTTKGWSTMGELVDGDEVFGPDGKPTSVIAHPIREGRPCYKITFRDGQEIVADEDHLWEVSQRHGSYSKTKVLTTKQIVEAGVRFSNGFRFSVPVTDPLQMPESNLPIDPWLLGYWLGDGDSDQSTITCGEKDLDYLLGRIEALGIEYSIYRYEDKAPRIYLKGVRSKFIELGVMKNKHIPDQYLRASESQRRQLLAGLMDSDGSVGTHQAVLNMQSEAIMVAALELARSLGYRSTLRKHPGSLNGQPMLDVWWLKFSMAHPDNPFGLPRKREKYSAFSKSERGHDLKGNAIVSVEPVETRPTRCITVDNDSSLYLAGRGFVATHNTQNSRGFARENEPKHSWVVQTNIGMHYRKLDRTVLLVQEMGYPFSTKEFHVEKDQAMLDRIFEKFEYVRDCIQKDTPPPCDHHHGSPERSNCPFRETCDLIEFGN